MEAIAKECDAEGGRVCQTSLSTQDAVDRVHDDGRQHAMPCLVSSKGTNSLCVSRRCIRNGLKAGNQRSSLMLRNGDTSRTPKDCRSYATQATVRGQTRCPRHVGSVTVAGARLPTSRRV